MSACVTCSLMIRGQFSMPQFCDWIAHRASLLSLSGWVEVQGDGLLEVCVSGHPVLLEAMETACSLGPSDALVEAIEVRQHDSLTPDMAVGGGFSIRCININKSVDKSVDNSAESLDTE